MDELKQYSTEIIVGIYTIFNIIVFFIQKAQINKQKEIITSMTAFANLFKIEEVERYVELKSKRVMMEASDIISDNDKMKDIAFETVEDRLPNIQEAYSNIMEEKHKELLLVAFEMVKAVTPKKDRRRFIDNKLHNNKDVFIELLDDYENSNP